MTVDELPDIVYHGTMSVHKESLIAGIDINKGYTSTDFGQGFYTTGNYEQAVHIAKGRAKEYNKRHKSNDGAYPMVISYSVNKGLLADYRGLIFEDPNDKWKEFVYNNRVGNDFAVSNYHNFSKKYDYVYGFVADSYITKMVRNIRNGSMTFGELSDLLKPLKADLYDQLSFHSQGAISVLTMNNIEVLDKEVELV